MNQQLSDAVDLADELALQERTPNRPGKTVPTTNVIASLHARIMGFLKVVLQDRDRIEYEMKHFRALERSAAILLFWGSEHGVGNGDIDRALQNSDFLRETVVQVLLSIGALLSQTSILNVSPATETKAAELSAIIKYCDATLTSKEEVAMYRDYSDGRNKGELLTELLQFRIDNLSRLNGSLESAGEIYRDRATGISVDGLSAAASVPILPQKQDIVASPTQGPTTLPADDLSLVSLGVLGTHATNTATSETRHDNLISSDLSPDVAWSQQNLLSLDGGGIQSYWTLLVLQQLMEYIAEEELKRKDDDEEHHSFYPSQFPENVTQGKCDEDERRKQQAAPGARVFKWEYVRETRKFLPCHYFDYICGSSTGAFIAIMLGRFRMPVWDCMQEYAKMGNSIFGKPRLVSLRNIGIISLPKYSSTALEEAFQEVTARRGEQTANGINVTFPSSWGICKTFVTAFAYERRKNEHVSEMRLYLLRTYEHQRRERLLHRLLLSASEERRNSISADNWPIWRVARAATAAPMFFKELIEERNVLEYKTMICFSERGNGLIKNPTLEGITELEELHGIKGLGAVVSVGTSLNKPQADGKGIFKIAHTAFDRITDQNHVAENVDALELSAYWRFNDENGIGVALDEWEPNAYFSKHPGAKTLEKIETKFKKWALDVDNNKKLKDCAIQLVARRRARTMNAAKWEVYATNASFACIHGDCRDKPFADRTTLEKHMRRNHAVTDSEAQRMVERGTKTWQYQRPQKTSAI